MLKARHVNAWLVLAAILFAATATLAVLAVQTLVVTLNTNLTTTPPSRTLGGYNWTSMPSLPPIFFRYLYLLSVLAVVDVMTVQRLRREVHKTRAGGVDTNSSGTTSKTGETGVPTNDDRLKH